MVGAETAAIGLVGVDALPHVLCGTLEATSEAVDVPLVGSVVLGADVSFFSPVPMELEVVLFVNKDPTGARFCTAPFPSSEVDGSSVSDKEAEILDVIVVGDAFVGKFPAFDNVVDATEPTVMVTVHSLVIVMVD